MFRDRLETTCSTVFVYESGSELWIYSSLGDSSRRKS